MASKCSLKGLNLSNANALPGRGAMEGLGIDRAIKCTISYNIHCPSTFQCTRKRKPAKRVRHTRGESGEATKLLVLR